MAKINPIAPCGMNCSLCLAFQREKNHCDGCNSTSENKPKYCLTCKIKNCEKSKTDPKFCFSCEDFPCRRMKDLDKRYRTRYGVSFFENLAEIDKIGLKKFLESEQKKWTCKKCGGTLCVHRGVCPNCGGANPFFPES